MNKSVFLRLSVVSALTINLALVLTAQYRTSYDVYVHMFFADHYASNWWSLWETRWYTGFPVTSYPPLVHQIMALISKATSNEASFGILLTIIMSCLPVGVYSFARIFVHNRAASQAALASVFLPSLYLSAYTFGQLPTLAGLLFALFCFSFFTNFLRNGYWLDGARAVMLAAVVAAFHHGTLLLLPWSLVAISMHLLLNTDVGLPRLLMRVAIFAIMAGVAIYVVIWPFWIWGLGQELQTSIDHLSRHNFLLNPLAWVFFFPMYGLFLIVLPWIFTQLFHPAYRKRFISLVCLTAFLALLGLGGTTPLPRWLFGTNWVWLTYDRFSIWASVILIPLAVGFFAWTIRKLSSFQPALRKTSLLVIGGAFLFQILLASTLSKIIPTQPPTIPLKPVVDFLNQPGKAEWRYLTFGFGSQMARLSTLTDAATLDGSYFTARQLPELRKSGLGEIDSALWLPGGLSALDAVLDHASERGVRWGFVARYEYIPLLAQHGWLWRERLENGLEVWENPHAEKLTKTAIKPVANPFEVFSWGVFPLASLCITFILTLIRIR